MARALVRAAKLTALVSAVAWLLGVGFGDRWAWSQWLFWIPPLAVAVHAGGALALTLILDRRSAHFSRDGTVLSAIIVAGIAAGLHRSVGFGGRNTDDQSSVSMLQWNTNWPSGDDPRAMEFLSANAADIVLISNRGANTSRDLVRTWAGEHATVVGAGPFALVTRLPVVEVRQVAVGGRGRQLWWVARFEVAPPSWNGRVLRIAMLDLPSRPTIPKALIAEGLRLACEEGGLGEVDVAAGDFNATDGSMIITTCFPGFRDALAEAGRGWLATWPRRFPIWKIDHVLLGASVRATTAETRDPGTSDHRATVTRILPVDG